MATEKHKSSTKTEKNDSTSKRLVREDKITSETQI